MKRSSWPGEDPAISGVFVKEITGSSPVMTD
jgi:hypothetical protein